MLLDVAGLTVSLPTARGRVSVLHDVSLTLDRGERLGVVGESGSGKSMLALAVMGLLPEGAQVSGRLRLEGQDLLRLSEPQWCALRGRRMAMIFQEPMTALNPLHTIGRQVAEPLRWHHGLDAAAARAETLRLLEAVRLPQAAQRLQAYPHQLSGGQRQRVMIAMALAGRPELLLADEPTTALDVSLQRDILRLIEDLAAEQGLALLLISHDLGVMARHVQRVMVMYAGQGMEQADVTQLLSQPQHPYTRGLLAARPRLRTTRAARPLPTLPGQVPAAGALPPGCAFAPRCAWCTDACEANRPAMRSLPERSGAAWVRCVRWPVPAQEASATEADA